MSKLILFSCLLCLIEFSCCWFINDINTKMLLESIINNEMSDDEVDAICGIDRLGINWAYPGTKWCGPGNIAENYDDLGTEIEADMCCREHDYCPDVIPGGGTKHNLTNKAFYTRLNCDCDNKFLECLKAAHTKVATCIGYIYFSALQTKCFREDYPVIKCNKKGGWFERKCVEYTYDTNGKKIYQWFDVEDY